MVAPKPKAEHVLGHRQVVLRVGRDPETLRLLRAHLMQPHQACHAILTAAQAAFPQLLVDARTTVGGPRFVVYGFDLHEQLTIVEAAPALFPVSPVEVSTNGMIGHPLETSSTRPIAATENCPRCSSINGYLTEGGP